MIRVFSLLFILIATSSCKVTNLEIDNPGKYEVKLEGVNGFDFVKLLELNNENLTQKQFYVDYSGLALIKYSGGQIYPIYLKGKNTKVELFEPNTPPQFMDSPDNDFLYYWIGSYRKLQNDTKMLEMSVERLGKEDAFVTEIVKEQERLEAKRLSMVKELEGDEFLEVKRILQARVLNESSYGIKTKEDLKEQKEKYHAFVKENITILEHSDMLIEICKQYLMMNEYVSFTKSEFYAQIIEDTKNWMEIVSPELSKKEAVVFVTKNFFGRSMVAIANSVYESQEDLFIGKSEEKKPFELGEKIPDYSIKMEGSAKAVEVLKMKRYKVFSIVGKDDVISKVATISLARDIETQNSNIPVIIIPKKKLSPEHYVMDKMYARTLYFVDNDNITFDDYKDIPLFVVVDSDNKVIMLSESRKEVNQRITQ